MRHALVRTFHEISVHCHLHNIGTTRQYTRVDTHLGVCDNSPIASTDTKLPHISKENHDPTMAVSGVHHESPVSMELPPSIFVPSPICHLDQGCTYYSLSHKGGKARNWS